MALEKPPPTIETPRLVLRPFRNMLSFPPTEPPTVEDRYLRLFNLMRSDPRVMQYSFGGITDSSLAQTENWMLERMHRKWTFVVERKLYSSLNSPDGMLTEPIGSLGLRLPAENEKAADFTVEHAELGFMIESTFWGNGYTTEAVRALLEKFWAETENWDLVEGYALPMNTASLRVMEKCGFVFWKKDGDDVVYRVTRPGRGSKRSEEKRNISSKFVRCSV